MGEGGEEVYEGSQTLGEVFVVGQLVERPWSVFVYEKRHGVSLWWERKVSVTRLKVDA